MTDRNKKKSASESLPTVGIVVSQYLGTNAHGAEAHTVISFTQMLKDSYSFLLIGGEIIPEELSTLPRCIALPYFKLPQLIRKVLHIPAAILNTLVACRRYRPALLLCCSGPFYGGIACIIASKLFGIPVALRATEDYVQHYRFCSGFWAKTRQYFVGNILSMLALRHATMVIATGKRSREHFIAHGVAPERIVGIPGPIQRGKFHRAEDPLQVRRSLGLPQDKRIVLYVGGIQPVKGAAELVEVITKVLARSNEVHFVIVGKEVRGTTFTQQILSAGGNALTFLPPQSHQALCSYYQAANVLLFLTKVGVGYGQVNIEATLCGTPIVAWNPGLDVQEFLQESCVDTIDEIVERILKDEHPQVSLLPEQDDAYVKSAHKELFDLLARTSHGFRSEEE